MEVIDAEWVLSTPDELNLQSQGTSGTRKLETRRRNAFEQRHNVLLEIERIELRMGVVQRWSAEHEQYKAASSYIKIRDYRKALDRVELLIVQRLFELEKLNLSGTGTFWYYYNASSSLFSYLCCYLLRL